VNLAQGLQGWGWDGCVCWGVRQGRGQGWVGISPRGGGRGMPVQVIGLGPLLGPGRLMWRPGGSLKSSRGRRLLGAGPGVQGRAREPSGVGRAGRVAAAGASPWAAHQARARAASWRRSPGGLRRRQRVLPRAGPAAGRPAPVGGRGLASHHLRQHHAAAGGGRGARARAVGRHWATLGCRARGHGRRREECEERGRQRQRQGRAGRACAHGPRHLWAGGEAGARGARRTGARSARQRPECTGPRGRTLPLWSGLRRFGRVGNALFFLYCCQRWGRGRGRGAGRRVRATSSGYKSELGTETSIFDRVLSSASAELRGEVEIE
jgi:hypothetical protein